MVKTTFVDMVKAWETSDAHRLGSILTISFKDHPDVYNRFLAQRNKVGIIKIEDLIIHGDTALVFIGGGYFVGLITCYNF
jgi:hypothetical protein